MRQIFFFFKSGIDNSVSLFYACTMFVSVILDPSTTETAKSLASILAYFRFKKVQRACWENAFFRSDSLIDLKREIDKVTDYYDVVRIYQYPINKGLCITELRQKKWRRCILSVDQEKLIRR